MNIRLRFLAPLTLACAALSASAQTNFYGGAPSTGRGAFDMDPFGHQIVFDDFALGETTSIQTIFGNHSIGGTPNATKLRYEIRQGVSSGDGGTLLFSGVVDATTEQRGTVGSNATKIFTMTGAVSGVTLTAGTYWLGLSVFDPRGTTTYALLNTTGVDAVGGPAHDAQAFIYRDNLQNYAPARDGSDLVDFSMGVNGRAAPVPEPASIVALGGGLAAFLRKRRRA